MPEAIARKLKAVTGLDYVEGYGMSETMAATHINPPQRPKPQCLGIPVFDVDARVVDPATLSELPPGEIGEIIVHAPQVMCDYWNNPRATVDSVIELDGKRFLRTGDLARDARRGATFKALVVLKAGHACKVSAQDIIAWSHEHMAAYESPRLVEFVNALPKSGTGTIRWRELQDREMAGAPE